MFQGNGSRAAGSGGTFSQRPTSNSEGERGGCATASGHNGFGVAGQDRGVELLYGIGRLRSQKNRICG
jgi:hypothetical protein